MRHSERAGWYEGVVSISWCIMARYYYGFMNVLRMLMKHFNYNLTKYSCACVCACVGRAGQCRGRPMCVSSGWSPDVQANPPCHRPREKERRRTPTLPTSSSKMTRRRCSATSMRSAMGASAPFTSWVTSKKSKRNTTVLNNILNNLTSCVFYQLDGNKSPFKSVVFI